MNMIFFSALRSARDLKGNFNSTEGFTMFATVPSMVRWLEYGSEKKMAEGDSSAELLKEKANQYFKGRFIRLVN